MKLTGSGRHLFIGFLMTAGISISLKADTFSEAQPVISPSPAGSPQPVAPAEIKPVPSSGQGGSNEPVGEETASPDAEPDDEDSNDPLEAVNRVFFAINELLDFVIIRPVAEIYRAVLPQPVRNGVTNVLDNLFAPVVFLNHVLQGNPEQATVTVFRLLTNSTLGLFGLLDAATELGYPRYDTDFNETLITWGIDTGPYLVLPLIGPSCFRGTIGFIGDYYADPLNLYLTNRHHHKYRYWLTIRYGLDIISHREKLIEALDNLNSSDKYVTLRSVYFQKQAYRAETIKAAREQVQTQEENQ